MGHSFIRYIKHGDTSGPRWGRFEQGMILPASLEGLSVRNLIAAPPAVDPGAQPLQMADVHICAPIDADARLYCQGLNYAEHAAEAGAGGAHPPLTHESAESLIFGKDSGALCGPHDAIVRPPGVRLLDYEIELGLILRVDMPAPTIVTRETLGQFVAGLVICNDISARDVMFGATFLQWFQGKSYRTFCPAGPVLHLIAPSEAEAIFNLDLELSWNGEVRQRANTRDFVCPPHVALTHLSRHAPLRAGDCLLTGTPGGVIAQSSPEAGAAVLQNMFNDHARREAFTHAQLARTRFLEPGDVLEAGIRSSDGVIDLGRQRTPITDSQS